MTSETTRLRHLAARIAPGLCMNVVPLITEGAGKAGRPMHPQPRVQSKKAHERSHYRYTELVRPSLRNGLRLIRTLPGDRALLPPSPALLIADLTPASGSQNHTISPSALARFVCARCRVHRIPSRVDDVAQRPSVGQDVRSSASDLPDDTSARACDKVTRRAIFAWRLCANCPSCKIRGAGGRINYGRCAVLRIETDHRNGSPHERSAMTGSGVIRQLGGSNGGLR
jgi:hypothetical protein